VHDDFFHHQGSLDGLCSVYSAVNSLDLMTNGKVNCPELFETVIKNIGGRLRTTILNGMFADQFERRVLDACASYLLRQNIRFTYTTLSNDKLGDYWTAMQRHHKANGEGSIILSVTGDRYNHWTCVHRISNRCIMLADSGCMKRLYRSRITIKDANKARLHTLLPTETFLLSLS
jgi:hypothetical protein